MNPFIHATVRDSSAAEVEALHRVCEQLAGFNPDIQLEWVDGFLTSLAAGPQLREPEVWLAALCGDAFERAFADLADQQRAQRVLHTRLKVLCEQLNPEQLLDDAQALRLSPLMMEWTEADRHLALQAGALAPEDVPVLVTGAEWALGFIDGTESFKDAWLGALDDDAHERAQAQHGPRRCRAGPQRPLSMWQRQEVQKVPRRCGRMSAAPVCCRLR